MHALGRLIRQRQALDPTLTYQKIAEKAGCFTYGAVGTWAKESATHLEKMPDPDNIVGLARALRVSPLTVLLAAAEAAGIDVTQPEHSRFAEQIPADIDKAPIEDQELALRVIMRLLKPVNNEGSEEK